MRGIQITRSECALFNHSIKIKREKITQEVESEECFLEENRPPQKGNFSSQRHALSIIASFESELRTINFMRPINTRNQKLIPINTKTRKQ